ncbi:MAG: transcriptional activator NhaR [Acidobacteria bacterium]|nr:transcriptional activator NhaR [Acidobacteriota bacterium]MDA1233875.1 transcriptional activator NhaR [Acidobacteriota bacterium]
MQWLNYHHLFYFWTIARAGGVTAASEELGLAQPTLSAQLRSLEEFLGQQLFVRIGRRLELTEAGRTVYRYSNDIFSLGREMLTTLEGGPSDRRQRLRVGVADVLPKMVVTRVLRPLLSGEEDVHLICYEGKPAELLARLASHEIDIVLSDAPAGPEHNVRAFNHDLGTCGVSVFAPKKSARHYRKGFPDSLDGAPFVMPTENTALRRMLDHWFARRQIHPRVLAEFEDSALLKAFTQTTPALFAAPSVIKESIADLYGAVDIGSAEGVRERFFAISLERRVRNPAVMRLVEAAHEKLFYFA